MKKYDLAILAAGCFWGVIGLFTRELAAIGVASEGVLILRSGGCALFFALVCLFRDPKLFRVRWKDLWLFIGFGFITLFFTYCYYHSIALSSLGVACTLMYCAPAFVTLFSVFFFHEKFTAIKGLALACALAGCVFVSGILENGGSASLAGIAFGLLSGIGYALYSVLSKALSLRGYSILTLNVYGWGLSAVGSLLLFGFSPAAPVFGTVPHILLWIGMVLVSGAAPAILYNWGLGHVEASKGSVMCSVEPVVATIAGFLFFGETPTLLTVLGIVLVLGAVVILNVKPRKKQPAGP